MASSAAATVAFLLFSISAVLRRTTAAMDGFNDLFQPIWAVDHLDYDGELLRLKLDNSSGTGIISKSKYLFGKVMAEMKLPDGDSAGTVTAFYMSSGDDADKHNEFDIEFLGNSSGEPYLMQTNVYVKGKGNREERMGLWFDPREEFHRYSVVWGRRMVVFMVDETPVRVHRNEEGVENEGRGMTVETSIWNADDWATQGGRVKTNWSNSPFVASLKGVRVEACEWAVEESEEGNKRRCNNGGLMEGLSVHQRHQLRWARTKHMVYSYCEDKDRFTVAPTECVHHTHRRHQ